MDDWTGKELRRIFVGGNARCVSFFKSSFIKYALQLGMHQPNHALRIRFEDWNIPSKYNSNVGETLRARLDLLTEGIAVGVIPSPCYVPPTVQTVKSSRLEATNEKGKLARLTLKKKNAGCFNYFFSALVVPHNLTGVKATCMIAAM